MTEHYPAIIKDQSNLYWIGPLIDDISVGIKRNKPYGYLIFFQRNDNETVEYQIKDVPWQKRGIGSDLEQFLKKKYPTVLSKYSSEHLSSLISDFMGHIQEVINQNPQVASLLTPDDGREVLHRIVSVIIYPTYDAANGGKAYYEIEVADQQDPSGTRIVSLTSDEMVSDSPNTFKKRWSSIFPKEFPIISRDDWIMLRQALVDQAILKEIDQTGEMDGIIENLKAHLHSLSIVDAREKWGKNPHRTLLYEKIEKSSIIYVNTSILQAFLKRNDLATSIWLPKLSRECQKRGITLGNTIKIRPSGENEGEGRAIRVWVFDSDAIGFSPDMLVKDSSFVPGGTCAKDYPGTEYSGPEVEVEECGGL